MLDGIILEDAQEELLFKLIRATQNIPPERRQKFLVLQPTGKHLAYVYHPGLPNNIEAYLGDIDSLAEEGLLRLTPQDESYKRLFDVTPLGVNYYKKRKSGAITRPEGNAMTEEPTEKKSKRVWVIHGRNKEIAKNVFQFLRALGLDPIEWSEARAETGLSSPYTGEILGAGFDRAQAFVVLLTGDDEARLREEFLSQNDPEYERNLTPQARPNVIFEAGMAFGRDPRKVIFIQQGRLRPFSNISGIHFLELNNTPEKRLEFVRRLMDAGCSVKDFINKSDWLSVGDFESDSSKQLGVGSKIKPHALNEADENQFVEMMAEALYQDSFEIDPRKSKLNVVKWNYLPDSEKNSYRIQAKDTIANLRKSYLQLLPQSSAPDE